MKRDPHGIVTGVVFWVFVSALWILIFRDLLPLVGKFQALWFGGVR